MKFDISKIAGVVKKVTPPIVKKLAAKANVVSPDVLTGIGVGLVFAGTVVACIKTKDAINVIDECKAEVDFLAEDTENARAMCPPEDLEVLLHDNKKKLVKCYVHTGVKLAKIYALPAGLEIAGALCIGKGHMVLKDRNVKLVAAYEALERAYQRAIAPPKTVEKDENGNPVPNTPEVVHNAIPVPKDNYDIYDDIEASGFPICEGMNISPYARFFDESSGMWKKDPEYNLMVVRMAQTQLNNKLHREGFVFLNDLYDELDIPRTNAGAVVGWMTSLGDTHIDLGVYRPDSECARSFVNGYERSVLINPNCTHIIFNKL